MPCCFHLGLYVVWFSDRLITFLWNLGLSAAADCFLISIAKQTDYILKISVDVESPNLTILYKIFKIFQLSEFEKYEQIQPSLYKPTSPKT